MVQTGDPTGTGKGGTSIWGRKFEDEIDETLKVKYVLLPNWFLKLLRGFPKKKTISSIFSVKALQMHFEEIHFRLADWSFSQIAGKHLHKGELTY